MNEGSPRILIVRLSAIGDVVRVVPVLHVLRETYPDARIDWAVERKSASIIEEHPFLDELHVFERKGSFGNAARDFWAFSRRIRANRYDIVLDFHGILKTGLLTGISGARTRVGFSWPRAQEGSFLFTNRKVRLSSARLNRVEENLALCSAVAPKVSWPSITLYVAPDVQHCVEEYFEEVFDGGKQVVLIHAPVDRPEKQWPLSYYAELADHLMADGRFEVLLTWGPGQLELAQEVARLARRKPVVAPEMPDLKHYAWLAHLAALYIGGDTGPMHIASAMGTPVVAIFGGTDPAKHAPYRPPYEVLYHGDPAHPRAHSPAERLQNITPEMAYDACIRLLSQNKQPAQTS